MMARHNDGASHVELRYTDTPWFVGRASNHALVVGTGALSGAEFAIRGGYDPHFRLKAEYGDFNETFKDPPSSVLGEPQKVGTLNMSMDRFERTTMVFADKVNMRNYLYHPLTHNSNTYAFSFVEHLGFPRPAPSVSAWGADKALGSCRGC
jgi:hypothetical protein